MYDCNQIEISWNCWNSLVWYKRYQLEESKWHSTDPDLAVLVITIIEIGRLLIFSYFRWYVLIVVLRRHMNQTIRITAGLRWCRNMLEMKTKRVTGGIFSNILWYLWQSPYSIVLLFAMAFLAIKCTWGLATGQQPTELDVSSETKCKTRGLEGIVLLREVAWFLTLMTIHSNHLIGIINLLLPSIYRWMSIVLS